MDRKRSGSISAALLSRLRRTIQEAKPKAQFRRGQDRQHILSALLPDQDAEHDAAHAQDGEKPTHDVYLSTARIRHVMHHLDAGEHDADDHYLKQKGDSPGEKGSDEPTQQGSDCGRNGGRGADKRIDLFLGSSSKLPWMSDCIAGSSSDAPIPPMMAQKMMIAKRFW